MMGKIVNHPTGEDVHYAPGFEYSSPFDSTFGFFGFLSLAKAKEYCFWGHDVGLALCIIPEGTEILTSVTCDMTETLYVDKIIRRSIGSNYFEEAIEWMQAQP